MRENTHRVAKRGGYRYERNVIYVGDWSGSGKREGSGHLLLEDGTRFDGYFLDGVFNGVGILQFPDGSKYEGEFVNGWFHGNGVFWRADGMKHEGEFRGGKIWGLGLTTFKDDTNGFPRCEGYFQDCRLIRKKKCPEIVQRAQKLSYMIRQEFNPIN